MSIAKKKQQIAQKMPSLKSSKLFQEQTKENKRSEKEYADVKRGLSKVTPQKKREIEDFAMKSENWNRPEWKPLGDWTKKTKLDKF